MLQRFRRSFRRKKTYDSYCVNAAEFPDSDDEAGKPYENCLVSHTKKRSASAHGRLIYEVDSNTQYVMIPWLA